jgi:hypothetical protein
MVHREEEQEISRKQEPSKTPHIIVQPPEETTVMLKKSNVHIIHPGRPICDDCKEVKRKT